MTEQPIMFSAPMVRAILEGRKSQTRRVLKLPKGFRCFDMAELDGHLFGHLAPNDARRWGDNYGDDGAPLSIADMARYAPGDLLWVKEAYFDAGDHGMQYKADWGAEELAKAMHRWQSPLFMPRLLSRITLRVTTVRVQRVQEITLADELAEGAPIDPFHNDTTQDRSSSPMVKLETGKWQTPRAWYHDLWNSLHTNTGHTWETNPWVVAISFERVP